MEERDLASHLFLQKENDQTRELINKNFIEQLDTLNQIETYLDNPVRSQSFELAENEILLENVYNEGFSLFQEQRFKEALQVFSQAVKIYPYDREIQYHYLASLYYAEPYNRKNYPALKIQLELLSYDLEYCEESMRILIAIALKEDDLEKIARLYKRLYDFDESNTDYLKSRGMVEYQLAHCETASDLFHSYLFSSPDDYEAVYYYGLSLFNTGNYEKALEQFYLSLKASQPMGNVENMIRETNERLGNTL
jgi:tetratricopeptide (TPR) repeat protein